MEKTSKRIIMSILTLVLVVVALGTTTFAWFTLSNVSLVNNIEAQVIAGEGLEVQMKVVGEDTTFETGFKSNLGSEDWNAVMAFIQADKGSQFEFKAVSTNGNAEVFTKVNIAEGVAAIGQDTESNKDYLEIIIEFRSQTEGMVDLTNITFDLSASNLVTFAPEQAYIQQPGNEGADLASSTLTSTDVRTRAANAARIAFKNSVGNIGEVYQLFGTAAYSMEGTSLIGNIANNEPQLHGQWSYLHRMGEHIYSAPVYDNSTTPPTLTTHPAAIGEFTDFDGIEMLEAVEVGNSTFVHLPIVSLDASTLTGGYYRNSLTMLVWMEGWDVDAYDAIFNSLLTFSLTFERKE